MKKFYLLTIAALAAGNIMAGNIVLDLSKVTNPATLEFNGEAWAETYSESFPTIEVAPFKLSHLSGGSSWGGTYYDGFTFACSDDKTNGGVAHQWGNIAGGGIASVDGDDITVDATIPYVLAYWSEWTGPTCNEVTFTTDKNYTAVGAYVVNTTYTYLACKDGASPAVAFTQEGDSFKLIAHGVKDGEEVAQASIELAGFSDGAFHAIDKWTWWDLSALGEVNKIYFTMSSTDVGDWGINTPTYFALDRLTVVDPDDTGVEAIDAERTVAARTYVNMAGQTAAEPFAGVNIVVTRYTDGTTSSVKVVK